MKVKQQRIVQTFPSLTSASRQDNTESDIFGGINSPMFKKIVSAKSSNFEVGAFLRGF
jgi:hypothetical protein